jgi:hypothetical protein
MANSEAGRSGRPGGGNATSTAVGGGAGVSAVDVPEVTDGSGTCEPSDVPRVALAVVGAPSSAVSEPGDDDTTRSDPSPLHAADTRTTAAITATRIDHVIRTPPGASATRRTPRRPQL